MKIKQNQFVRPIDRNKTTKSRMEFIDALKGFAIFCVLWGHSIQYLKNSYDFFHDPMFEFIYSFHMPLFFMISGFFFKSSLNLNLKDFCAKKGLQLLLPCLTWTVICCALFHLIKNDFGQSFNDWANEVKSIFSPFRWNFWFLREIFISYSIVYLLLKIINKQWLALILSICFVLIAPCCGYQRVLLPVFWVGIYLKDHYEFILKHAKRILMISGTFFGICLLFWNGYHTMYRTIFPRLLEIETLSFNFTNIDIAFFRLFVGLCGSLFWFMLFKIIYGNNGFFICLRKIGASTLAIYIIQTILYVKVIPLLTKTGILNFSDINIRIYTLLITFLASLVVLGVCIGIIRIIEKNKYAELLLFGKIKTS